MESKTVEARFVCVRFDRQSLITGRKWILDPLFSSYYYRTVKQTPHTKLAQFLGDSSETTREDNSNKDSVNQAIDGNLKIEKRYKNYEHLNLIRNTTPRNTYWDTTIILNVSIRSRPTFCTCVYKGKHLTIRIRNTKALTIVKKNSKRTPLIGIKSDFF